MIARVQGTTCSGRYEAQLCLRELSLTEALFPTAYAQVDMHTQRNAVGQVTLFAQGLHFLELHKSQ